MDKCNICQSDAFRHCRECKMYLCGDHSCEHLDDTPVRTWLSDVDVVGNMTDEQLVTARVRLASQLYLVDRELGVRKFDHFRRNRPKINLSEADLIEERSVRRFGGSRTKTSTGRKKDKVAEATKQGLADAIAALTPEQRARISEAMKRQKENVAKL